MHVLYTDIYSYHSVNNTWLILWLQSDIYETEATVIGI